MYIYTYKYIYMYVYIIYIYEARYRPGHKSYGRKDGKVRLYICDMCIFICTCTCMCVYIYIIIRAATPARTQIVRAQGRKGACMYI